LELWTAIATSLSPLLNAAASAALQPKDQSATADVASIYNFTCLLNFLSTRRLSVNI